MKVRTIDNNVQAILYGIQQRTGRYRDDDWSDRVVLVKATTNEKMIEIDSQMTVHGQVFTTSDGLEMIHEGEHIHRYHAQIPLEVGNEIIVEAEFSACDTKMYCIIERTE